MRRVITTVLSWGKEGDQQFALSTKSNLIEEEQYQESKLHALRAGLPATVLGVFLSNRHHVLFIFLQRIELQPHKKQLRKYPMFLGSVSFSYVPFLRCLGER